MYQVELDAGFVLFSGSILTDTTNEYGNGGVDLNFMVVVVLLVSHLLEQEMVEQMKQIPYLYWSFRSYWFNSSRRWINSRLGNRTSSISKNGVELSSEESGLRVVNPAGREVVYVGSRSLQEVMVQR